MAITNVMFAGVGGQGILTSGRLLGVAALRSGLDVKMSEVHGMSQRGGNVDAHVRIGPEVPSPLIPKGGAHFIVSFEKMEALRYMDFLRPDGVVLTSDLEVHPLSTSLKETAYVRDIDAVLASKAPRLLLLHALEEARTFGDVRMVNVLLLGALSTFLAIPGEHWESAVRERFPAKIQETCWRAFQRGVDLARDAS